MIKNIFVFIFLLLAGLCSCQVTNNPKPVSECDSIRLKVDDNWKYGKYSYLTNLEFVKSIVNKKACFMNKDTSEISQIFGKNCKLGRYSIKQNGLYYFGAFDNKRGVNLVFVLGGDSRVEDIVPLYLDTKSKNVPNTPKPSSSLCDSIKLKIADNWKHLDKGYKSNANFIKEIIKYKGCFVGMDSLELGKIFGTDHSLMGYKKLQDALCYSISFDKQSYVSLFFVLDNNGHLEDIDPVYLDSGETVK